MLRGLIVRQFFFVVDLVLMCLIGLVAVLAIKNFMNSSVSVNPPKAVDVQNSGTFDVAKLSPADSYKAIIENKLFGDAGQQSNDTAAPEPEATIERPPPTLPLKLLGTTTTGPKDPLATAIIQNARPKDVKDRIKTYYINETILDQISLAVVYKRWVLLWNAATRKWIELPMDEDDGLLGGEGAQATQASLPQNNHNPPGVFTLQRKQLVQDVMDASTKLAQMRPRIAYDKNGKAIGVTADGLDKLDLAKKLGFKQGDVVQAINGRTVDSMDKVYEILQQFQGLDTVRVSVLRDGKPTMMTYRLH